jgi:hypothetical protein
LRRFDELVELQQAGKKRASTHAMISLESAISDAERTVTNALEDAGILEHRAIITGKNEDADAYAKALVRVDAAYAELWATEMIGQRLRIENVSNERQEVIDESKADDDKTISRSLEKRMELRRKIVSLVATPEAAVQLAGIRTIGPGARDLSEGSDAATALRRRLSQVARASDGPTTVKVVKKNLLSGPRRGPAKKASPK